MRSKDQLRLLTPADAVAINRKMRWHEVRLAYSAQIALETEVGYQPNVVLLVIGLPATVARSGLRTSPGQASRSANTSGIHDGAYQATLDAVEERLRRVDAKCHPIHEQRWVCRQ